MGLVMMSSIHFATASDDFRPIQAPNAVQSGTVAGQPIWTISAPEKKDSKDVNGIVEFSFAPGIGSSTTTLKARFNGEVIEVFPTRDLPAYTAAAAKDPNAPFKYFNTPLFPMTNRLMPEGYPAPGGKLTLGERFDAMVEKIKVRMTLNNKGSKEGAVPHHLHGLLFDKSTSDVTHRAGSDTTVRSTHTNILQGQWAGEAEAIIEQGISSKGAFTYSIEAKNTGQTPIPVGFGSHPYFKLAGGDPASVKLVIPSKRTAVIDNLDNVLPTGVFEKLDDLNAPLNFNRKAKGTIAGKFIDNYFILDRGADVQLIDFVKKLKYRLRPTTNNTVGVQVFYPAKGDVIAVELVTHHPDPRQELWKKEPTGMKILKPGKSEKYSYTIEVLPLDASDKP